jgi:inhibitor of KinA sporulation pathway (predicted exonuclease)
VSGTIVYDLEYTTWEGARDRGWSGPGEHREVVQLGAVRLDGGAELSLLVKPRLNPVLSDYFIELTGITRERVEAGGTDFGTALARLEAFAAGAVLVSNGGDEAVLRENCRLTNAAFPFDGRCRDVSALLARQAGAAAHVFSCDMIATFGLEGGEAAHDALGDARQVALVLRHLLDSGRIRPSDLL